MRPASFSHYRVESELGRGGMAVVYRAYDDRLRRPVAIKVLADALLSDPRRGGRILEEARAASALNHPSITTIYDIGDENGVVFIVMELVEGRNLRSVLNAGPVSPAMILRVGVEIAGALATAHAHGIVHGDVKPENVMMRADGTVKLLDFGIARQLAVRAEALTGVLDATDEQTAIQTVGPSGTLPYMAPELLTGGAADGRTDLFALGVLLYEAFAGRRPFEAASSLELIGHILGGTPPRLESNERSVPSGCAGLVGELLEKDPRQRPQTAAEVVARLSSMLRDAELAAILPQAVAGKRAIGVLPFRVLSPDPNDEYLGTALADALIGRLGESGAVLVRPMNAVMRFTRQAIDPVVAGRELNVDVVVDGSVQRAERRLRVQVHARQVADGEVLTSARHDADMSDLFVLQDATADAVIRGLGLNPASDVPSQPPTKNPKAYELFLRACERLSRFNQWDLLAAIGMLEEATRLDPRFADAWGRLAETYANMHLSYDSSGHWYTKSQRAVRRALSIQPQNALTEAARARNLWNPTAGFKIRLALRACARALRLNPACQPAWMWQGAILSHLGLQEEARASLLAALEMNPDDAFSLAFIGLTFLGTGDYDGADDFIARALRLDRASLYAHLFRPVAALYRGIDESMTRAIQEARSTVGDDPLFQMCEAVQLARDGRAARARAATTAALKARSIVHTHHTTHLAGAVFAILGDRARAVAMLRKASKTGLPNYSGFRDDRLLTPLHGYKPFQQLLAGLQREVDAYSREIVSAAVIRPATGSH